MDSSPSDRVMKQYQVFLSFRGEDTSRTIISHLHKALVDKGIDTFKDDIRIEIGDSISDEIKEAIQNSKIAIVVISENYASSNWCLNELQMIMELHTKHQLTVVPIFYDVTPTDIIDLSKTFSLERYTEEAEKVLKWRKALTEIAGISGKVSKTCDNEAKMIEDIVRRVSRQLFSLETIDFGDIVGMNTHTERLDPLLKLESEGEVRIIGIWGMGGVGKTTIAKFLYKVYSHAFAPHRLFIEDVSTITGHGYLLHLQKRLLSTVGAEHEKLWSVEQGCSVIKSRFRKRKVFLVIDGINHLDQLHALVKEISWFGKGTRIIVTTRDKGLLDSGGVKLLYHVSVLDKDNAILLFKHFAFEGGEAPSDAYERLAIQASYLAQGLPSALKDFGTFLRRMTSIEEWEEALGGLKEIPQQRIVDILRTSYEGLDRKHKAVFLHIACLFNGDSVESVKALLRAGDMDIKSLEQKSLLDISVEGYINMHALVEQAGKEFVREQSSSTPQEHKILWEHEKIISVLQNTTRTSTSMESLALHMCDMPQALYMTGKIFDVSNLKFLKVFRHVNHTESKLQFIPNTEKFPQNVLLLHWDGFPLATLPPNEYLQSIVEINLRHSKLERLWDTDLRLGTLRRLDVSYSTNLKEPPKLSLATKLEELLMEGCTKLERLPKSIGSLSRLKTLNFSRCDGLANLQIHVSEQLDPNSRTQRRKVTVNLPEEVNKLSSLANLSIGGRINIQLCNLEGDADHITIIAKQKIPHEYLFSKYYDFTLLNIKRTSYIEDGAPFNCISFFGIPFLVELKLINLNIENIPDNIGQLQLLQKLDLSGNNFSNLPTSMKHLCNLEYVSLSNCTKLEALPELTTKLHILKLSGCTNLRSLLVICSLQELGLDNCKSIQPLSEKLSNFKNLIHLDLSRHDFETLPESIRELLFIGTMCLNNCKKLKSLEYLPQKLKHLYAHGCDSLENVSISSNHSIEHLDLSHCFSMKQGHQITQISDDGYNQLATMKHFGCYPGNEVPSYFENQAIGTSTMINLPPIMFANKPLDFAVCIMIDCERSFHLQFPALTYDWNCEIDGIIQINLKPNIYVSSETKDEESVKSHHLVILHVQSSINTERFDELRIESHLQLPEEFEIPPAKIRACGVRVPRD